MFDFDDNEITLPFYDDDFSTVSGSDFPTDNYITLQQDSIDYTEKFDSIIDLLSAFLFVFILFSVLFLTKGTVKKFIGKGGV